MSELKKKKTSHLRLGCTLRKHESSSLCAERDGQRHGTERPHALPRSS